MSSEPKLDCAVFEALHRAVVAENPGRSVGIVLILVEEGYPPNMISTFCPEHLPDLLTWLVEHHDEAEHESLEFSNNKPS